MPKQERVRVFIGSGEASLLERKTLIYSLRKFTQRELDIYVFNGTHNAIEVNDKEPYLAPLPLHLKYQNRVTEFSLYRFLIPELCNYQGMAIYLDSDMVCLEDIGKLFDTDLEGCDFLVKNEAYQEISENLWGLSAILFDCSRCKFDLEEIFSQIDQGFYTYSDFSRMSSRFVKIHPYQIGKMPGEWNSFDYWDHKTKIIHYTNLYTQPWKYRNHPYGDLWFRYFKEAMEAGYISMEDVRLSIHRSYVRKDVLYGNSLQEIFIKKLTNKFKGLINRFGVVGKPIELVR